MRSRGLCSYITGHGRDEQNLAAAKDKGIIDSYSLDPSEAVAGADLVVLAVPVGAIATLAATVAPSLKEGALLVDAGSVKAAVLNKIEPLMPSHADFVGCHPIAGSERTGHAAADAELFNGSTCVITPSDATSPDALEQATGLWEAMGMNVRVMNAPEHDLVMALVSHLPHLAASALINTITDAGPDTAGLSGGGLRDTTRIAASDPALWRQITQMNSDNIINSLRAYERSIGRLCKLIEEGDFNALQAELKRASGMRRLLD